MINPEYDPIQNPDSEIFQNLIDVSEDSKNIVFDFRQKLLMGFDKISHSDISYIDLMSLVPSLDIAQNQVRRMGSLNDNYLLIVAQSRLDKIVSGIDLLTCRFIDKDRIGYGLRRSTSLNMTSDENKGLNYIKTVLPLIDNRERFDLTKYIYSVNNFRTGEVKPLNIDYVLSSVDYLVRDPQK